MESGRAHGGLCAASNITLQRKIQGVLYAISWNPSIYVTLLCSNYVYMYTAFVTEPVQGVKFVIVLNHIQCIIYIHMDIIAGLGDYHVALVTE